MDTKTDGRLARLGASPGYRYRVGDFAIGKWSGETLFLAGVVGVDYRTGKVIQGYSDLPEGVGARLATGQVSVDAREGPIVAQAWHVFTTIEGILESQGLSLRHIVNVTHLLTDLRDFPAYNRVRSLFFTDDPPPGTLCCVKELLPTPEVRLEVEVAASRSEPQSLGPVASLPQLLADADSLPGSAR